MRSLFCRKESKLNWSLFFLPDIDECSAVISNNCDVNAACTNTAGSFSCKCKRGYSGNGTNCKSKCMCLRMIKAKSFGCNLKNNYSLGSCLMHMCIWHWKVLSWKYNGSLHRKGLFCFLQTWMNVLIHQRTTVTPLPVVQTPMETLLVLVTLVTKEMVLTARVSVGQWLWKGRRMFFSLILRNGYIIEGPLFSIYNNEVVHWRSMGKCRARSRLKYEARSVSSNHCSRFLLTRRKTF